MEMWLYRPHFAEQTESLEGLVGRTTIIPAVRAKDASMCDHSLNHATTPPKVADKVITTKFDISTIHGFAEVVKPNVAVCVVVLVVPSLSALQTALELLQTELELWSFHSHWCWVSILAHLHSPLVV
jgi:hypothetical protein